LNEARKYVKNDREEVKKRGVLLQKPGITQNDLGALSCAVRAGQCNVGRGMVPRGPPVIVLRDCYHSVLYRGIKYPGSRSWRVSAGM